MLKICSVFHALCQYTDSTSRSHGSVLLEIPLFQHAPTWSGWAKVVGAGELRAEVRPGLSMPGGMPVPHPAALLLVLAFREGVGRSAWIGCGLRPPTLPAEVCCQCTSWTGPSPGQENLSREWASLRGSYSCATPPAVPSP